LEKIEEGNPVDFYYPISENYFTVFESNAGLIGKIKNDDLRETIVETYTQVKGMIDSFKMNNYFILEVRKFGVDSEAAKGVRRLMIEYRDKLSTSHYKLKESMENMLSLIKKEVA